MEERKESVSVSPKGGKKGFILLKENNRKRKMGENEEEWEVKAQWG